MNNFFNLIPHCVAFGEAAGTAAALSVSQGVSVRKVDYPSLRRQLIAQNVPLPGVYPARYERVVKAQVAVYESPAFGEKRPKQ